MQLALAHRVGSDPFAEIVGLVVGAAWRGRGIGVQLVAAAESWARRAGASQLRVRSNVVREATHRFYEHRGMTRTKAQAVFVKRL